MGAPSAHSGRGNRYAATTQRRLGTIQGPGVGIAVPAAGPEGSRSFDRALVRKGVAGLTRTAAIP